MDSKKLAFLKAVVGSDGAEALHRATERSSELGGAIYPRAILAWLDLVKSFDGILPGTSCRAAFKKTETGYDGYVTLGDDLYDFNAQDLYHLAGSIAVAIGADDEKVDPELTPALVAKLGKSIDVLVKSTLVRQELAKTSWNVKQRRAYQFEPGAASPKLDAKGQPVPLDGFTVDGRRRQYARSIGLKPTYEEPGWGQFPAATKNKLPYGRQFGLEHESAHAMMTPAGKTINQYQKQLTQHAEARPRVLEDEGFDQEHEDAVSDENVANNMESRIDRRSGVDPHKFASKFRTTLVNPNGDSDYQHYMDEEPDYKGKDVPPEGYREAAKYQVGKFDAGAKFDKNGRIQQPNGVDAKINQRAALGKDEMQKPKAKNRIQLPGQTAKPNAPQAPTPPIVKQPKMQTAQPGAVATSPSKLATPDVSGMGAAASGAPVMAKPAKPVKGAGASAKVIKSQAYARCAICGEAQFRAATFTGCRCFKAMAKSVTVTETKTHFQLAFGDGWDTDAIESLIAALGK